MYPPAPVTDTQLIVKNAVAERREYHIIGRKIMIELPNKSLLRPAKVAEILNVSLPTVYYWIAIGKIEAIKLPGRTLRISRSVVKELQEHTTLS